MAKMTKGQVRFVCKNIDTLRSISMAFLVPLFGAIAYLYVNFSKLSRFEIIGGVCGIVICVAVIACCYFRYNFYMNQIKELE